MKKQLLLILTIIFSFNCYSQISFDSFEKGYYIDNNDQKINCLIKYIDWENNPTEFEYKPSENSESKKATIKSIKEFGINNILKYVRSTVNIDRSSENIKYLSNDRNPIFQEEELFLKMLVEGKANLYIYEDNNLKRFFYNKDNSEIKQLIFKTYKNNENKIGENNRFRQQLWVDLKCRNLKTSKIENLGYTKTELVRLFIEYSECHNKESISFEIKQKRDFFNLTIRPRVNNSSLTIQNSTSNFIDNDFGSKNGFGFGLEAEFILPFGRNKWAIAIEAAYQDFNVEKTKNVNSLSGGVLISKVSYRSIEIPVSLRHYFFLNKNSKIFINGSYILDSSLKSSIEFSRADNSNISTFEIKPQPNLGLGIGYKQNDKYSLELRYQTDRNILPDFVSLNTAYETLSIIFGYSLF